MESMSVPVIFAEAITKLRQALQTLDSLLSGTASQHKEVADQYSQSRQHIENLTENRQLQAANQELQQGIVSIREQLQTSEIRLSESASRIHEFSDRNAVLQAKIVELRQHLRESQMTIEEFEVEQERSLETQSENQKLYTENLQLQQDIANLQSQVQWSEARRNESASQIREIADHNSKLQTEVGDLRQQLQASQETIEELQTEQERFDEIKLENGQLQGKIANLGNQLETTGSLLSTTINRYKEIADRDSQMLAETTQALDKVTVKNKELLEEINSLATQLTASQRTAEDLQTIKVRLSSTQSENQQLHAANQEIQQKMADIQRQLQTSQARLSESAGQNEEITDRYVALQTEVISLKQQVEESQPKARELEAVQQQLAHVESREMIFRDRQHKQEAEIADLQRELSAGKEKIQELDATHKRLAEMEHVCRELREDYRGLEEEISRWQERLAGAQENQRQISILRQQNDELQTKQEALIGRSYDASSRRISDPDLSYARQSTTNTAGELTPESIDSAFIARTPFEMAVSEANSPINGLGLGGNLSPDDSGARIHVTDEEEIKPAVQILGKRKWPLAMIPSTVVFVIACALALGFLGTSSDKFSRSKEPAAALETASGEQWTPSEAAPDRSQKPTPASVSASGENEFSKQIRGSKPATRLRGTFKISHPTEVYDGPSENSALIASIEPGMNINVVDSRDGWLEIRSKHDRPSGFVRQDTAVRIN